MTSAQAIARVKYKFHIPQSNTTFDSDITEAVTIAVDALAPYGSQSAAANTSNSLAVNVDTLAWPFATQDIDKIFFRANASDVWQLVTGWYHDLTTIYFTEYFGEAVSLKILPTQPYAYADFASIPNKFLPPLVDFACSEFASFLAGSQAKFDNYVQATGAKSTDSLLNLSEFYENRANVRAREVADNEGVL